MAQRGVREELLELLEENKGTVLAGNDLAGRLGVTRSAVWKAVNALRGEGYDIRSIKKTGYLLEEHSDVLSLYKLRASLEDADSYNLRLYKTVGSTNLVAQRMALAGAPAWTVVAAEEQLEGVGRGKRPFCSPMGKGVYVSVLLRPDAELSALRALPLRAAAAVCAAIEELCGAKCRVLPPDDVVWQGRKVCGILTEALAECESGRVSFAVVGIGVSVYDDPGRDPAFGASLYEAAGRYCNRSELIAAILTHLRRALGLPEGDFRAAFAGFLPE